MEKTQVYLREEELDALRKAAARAGCSIAELVRDAIRRVVLKPQLLRVRLLSGTANQGVRPLNTIAFTTSPDEARGDGFRGQWSVDRPYAVTRSAACAST